MSAYIRMVDLRNEIEFRRLEGVLSWNVDVHDEFSLVKGSSLLFGKTD